MTEPTQPPPDSRRDGKDRGMTFAEVDEQRRIGAEAERKRCVGVLNEKAEGWGETALYHPENSVSRDRYNAIARALYAAASALSGPRKGDDNGNG